MASSLLLLWLSALGWAAPVGIALPAGELAADWEEPLALAGLVAEPVGEGPGSWVRVEGGRWRVVVRDGEGSEHTLSVAPPRSAAEREALAHLVASVARPVPLLAIDPVPVPEAPARVVAERPAPAEVQAAAVPQREAPPRVEVLAARAVAPARVVDASGLDELAAAVAVPSPVPSPWSMEGWGRLAGGFTWRDEAAAPSGSVFGGVGWGPARVGLGVSASGPHPIPVSGGLTWTHLDALAGAWFALPDGPVLGGAGGLSRRTYDRSVSLVRATALVELGWRVRLTAGWDLMPLLQLELDPGMGGLRRTVVSVDGRDLGELAPTAVRVQLALAPHG